MTDLFLWVSSLLGDAPAGLSWLTYVIVGVILLIIVDVILSLFIGAIQTIVTGGKK